MRLCLAAIVFSFGCAGNGAPTAPAPFETGGNMGGPSEPARVIRLGAASSPNSHNADRTADSHGEQALAGDTQVFQFEVVSDSQTEPAKDPRRPGKPIFVRASPNEDGTRVTVVWRNGSGAAPTSYVVTYNGVKKVVGLSTSYSAKFAIGRFTVVARNKFGESDPLIIEFKNPQQGGTFAGKFLTSGPVSQGGCTWRITYQGTAVVTLVLDKSGKLTGRMTMNGTWSVPEGTTDDPIVICPAFDWVFRNDRVLGIFGPNLTVKTLDFNVATGDFIGFLWGDKITGTVPLKYPTGRTGSATIGLTLSKQR